MVIARPPGLASDSEQRGEEVASSQPFLAASINCIVFNIWPTDCIHRSVLRRQIMKTQGSSIRLVLLLSPITALVGTQLACEKVMFWRSKPQEMHSAEGVLASEGTVRISDGDNGNTKVSIRVNHLAPPFKVIADSTVYVVWIRPKEDERQNVNPGPEQGSRGQSRHPDPAPSLPALGHAGTQWAGRGSFS